MSRQNRNRALFKKGLISEQTLKEIDAEMYRILVEKNKKELEEAKSKFEKIWEAAKKRMMVLFLLLQFLF